MDARTVTLTRNKKGQAMVETIFMLPFIIVILFFIYQSYTLINKVQVVQKYLKGGVIGSLMNRNIITAENRNISNSTVPSDGKYFMVFNDESNTTTGPASGKTMKVNLDDITINMLLYFCPSSEKGAVTSSLKGQKASETLGVCIGGVKAMGDQVSGTVLEMSEGDTCKQ